MFQNESFERLKTQNKDKYQDTDPELCFDAYANQMQRGKLPFVVRAEERENFGGTGDILSLALALSGPNTFLI